MPTLSLPRVRNIDKRKITVVSRDETSMGGVGYFPMFTISAVKDNQGKMHMCVQAAAGVLLVAAT